MPCFDCSDCLDDICCECDDSIGVCECDNNYLVCKKKRPLNNLNHVGIEIEFLAPVDRNILIHKLMRSTFAHHIQIKADGSVYSNRSDDLYGHELCVLAEEGIISTVLFKVCEFLRSIGATVNNRCGLHVHLDMRNRDHFKVFHNLVAVQDVLFAMQPASRKRSMYCSPNTSSDFAQAQRVYNRTAINPCSMRKYKTLEVRLHAGTTNFEKINNWIQLLLLITRKRNTLSSSVSTLQSLRSILKLPPSLQNYIASRIQRFDITNEDNVINETA